MAVYERNPDAPPDADFEPGRLHHLVVGNAGRQLDPRRTPVSLVAVKPQVGMFVVRIEDFEDRGACWEIPFERVETYQFARGSVRATDGDVRSFRAAVERFDRRLVIPRDPAAAQATLGALQQARRAAGAWLESNSTFLAGPGTLPEPSSRTGDERLSNDLRASMDGLGLGDMEDAFARQYVSGPHSGELIKGHRIVIAELGLVEYDDKIVRDPATFDPPWDKPRRVRHVLARMAFVHEVFSRLGLKRVGLYRGLSTDEPLEPTRNHTFVSATFDRAVAESHFDAHDAHDATRLLAHQAVPVTRLFMTYHETAAMNDRFKEAEAVLLYDPANRLF